MNKRILFISDHGDPLAPLGSEQAGGQNNYVKQLALALGQRGNSVDVLTHWVNPDDPQIEPFGKSCRVIRVAAGQKRYVHKTEMFKMLPAFSEEMRSLVEIPSYDLVHTHYWLSGLLGAFLKDQYNIPWIHTNHSLGIAKQQATGVAEPKRLSAEKIILQTADMIIATTDNERKLIREFVANPSPIHVIPIGVDTIFRPLPIRNKPETPYLAFAGRLEETKGIYTLIDAFRLLVESDDIPPSVKLIVAGGDQTNVDPTQRLPKKERLREAIDGLEDRIDFIGGQSQSQLAKLFNRSEGVIVPSYYESFGMVAAEAQACGRPVIASRVGGLKEVVKNRVTGLHVEKGNEDNLAHAMKTLLSNEDYANRLGKKAASFASIEFNWPFIAKRMDALYEVVIDDKKIAYASDGLGWHASR